MTKTEARRLVAELRREAAKVTQALTPAQEWIVRDLGYDLEYFRRSEQAKARLDIEEALNNIDGLSAMLREGLVDQ